LRTPLAKLRHDFASATVPADASDREKASLLYKAVRGGIRYNLCVPKT
jgi:hypothetical protein